MAAPFKVAPGKPKVSTSVSRLPDTVTHRNPPLLRHGRDGKTDAEIAAEIAKRKGKNPPLQTHGRNAKIISGTTTGTVKVRFGEYVLHVGRLVESKEPPVAIAVDALIRSLHSALSDGDTDTVELISNADPQLRDEEVQRLVDASQSNADKADAIQARMRAKAVGLVMNGTSWLTATELFGELPKKPSNVHTTLARWLEQGRIFAMEKGGVRIFPRYAFDAMLEPVPLLKEVLRVLAGRSPFQIASWFESPSNYLNGKRPREVLELNGLAVVAAAQRLTEGAVHG